MKPPQFLALFALVVSSVAPLGAQTAEQWIGKARSFLGGDKALEAVRSIHFTGTLELANGNKLPAEIIFQKPYQQKITVKGPNAVETTALDGYDGWQKRTNPENPTQWQITLLDAAQVKRLRANTLENLSFYSSAALAGAVVQVAGEAVVDGVPAVKLTFKHAEDIVFTRYFNKATGQLLKTETENGGEIREEGEMKVDGIRFPKRVLNKSAAGAVTAITFEQVRVNEVFPPDTFAVPSLQAR
jgi:outer membrane lipoprotein-sorting protein